MSLLNTFKGGATHNADQHPQPVSNAPSQGHGVGATASQARYPGGPHSASSFADDVQPAQRQYPPQNLPSIPAIANLYQQLDGTARQPAPQSGPLLGQPAQNGISDPRQAAHRSALLDMFKKQAPLSPTSSSDATVRPGQTENERPGRGAEVSRAPVQQQRSADARAVAPAPNMEPVVMNPELNLPFRATQILSRPKQTENVPSHGQPAPNTQVRGPGVPQDFGTSYNRLSAGALNSPNAAGVPAEGMLAGKQESNPEQRQKLLALFSKPQPSPNAVSSGEKGKQKEVVAEQPRSRVASLSGEGMQSASSTSRRGSGTPISPSDRDFLLNFLNTVSKQAL